MNPITFLFIYCFSFFCFGQNTATYDITFTSTWNAGEHSSIPSGAHWSRLVGTTHKIENTFLELGQNATTGIKNVAELGSNGAFMNEVNNSANTNTWYNEPLVPYGAVGSVTLTDVEFTLEHHLITLVSMVAPSPDWFMAVNSLDLRNSTNTAWKDSFTMDVFVYDAGTDDGVNYNSANSPNTPMPITMITGFPFNGNKIGTLTVTQKSLGTTSFTPTNKTLQLLPNPVTSGRITIKNANDFNLESIEIYNILGAKVYATKTPNQNIFSLNVNQLQNGVYVVKLISNSTVISKKLLVK